MIDIHCHILPAIDDGPPALEPALAMARLAVAAGTRKIIATPHVNDHNQDRALITTRVAEFNTHLQQHAIDLKVIPGGEVEYHLDEQILKAHCLGNSRYLLLEFPFNHLPSVVGNLIFRLCHAGLKPIIAHPERNASVLRDPKILSPLINQGALMQVTTGSLAGFFGRSVKSCAQHLLKNDQVHFLASDGHSPDKRTPVLTEGLKVAEKLIGGDKTRTLVTTNPAKIISNTPW